MNFKLSFTEEYISWVVSRADEKDVAPHGWRILTVGIEFAKRYDESLFVELPSGFYWYADCDKYCRICYWDLTPYVPNQRKQDERELRLVCRAFEKWCQSLFDSKFYKIYAMANLL